MRRTALAISLILGLALFTSVAGVLSTQRQMRNYFDMPAYVGPVPEHVRESILERVPIGTSNDKVETFLSLRGIGKDNNSICRAHDAALVCRIGTHFSAWEMIRETDTVSFTFDSDRNLAGVKVRSEYVGFWEKAPSI